MKRSNIALIIIGILIILFALITSNVHGLAWRLTVALLGCFTFISGLYKIIHKI